MPKFRKEPHHDPHNLVHLYRFRSGLGTQMQLRYARTSETGGLSYAASTPNTASKS